MSYKEGDVVILRSGGPRMTVSRAWNNEKGSWVECVWFDERTPKDKSFNAAVVQKYESDTGLR